MTPIKHEIDRCSRLTNAELWSAIPKLVKGEREDLVSLLIHLGEIERRDLHLEHAYSGLFRYLVALGYSEWESRARSIATMASTKYPSILGLLRAGRINLSALSMIGPLLTADNYRALIRKACRRSFRELQTLVAGISPQAARHDVVRVIWAPSPLGNIDSSKESQQTDPPNTPTDELFASLSTDWPSSASLRTNTLLRFSFDGPKELDELMERARALLSHKYPRGERGPIVLEAFNALLDKIDPERKLERRIKRSRTAREARQKF